ncbi:hypothetical protein [Nocardia pseudobrasiliensis]|uniref:Uncharacterized protein n=1 Tax=Nocardia pseudobrasiliensis TaxID=45979 RepID=A0A370I4K0_9NOCA|nr:hypothetical protein [Nocardia pseudobrasiliensis]RDI65658.1 hypothetical protein DFR76_106530 [Nocardia pseudobrasiliensis]
MTKALLSLHVIAVILAIGPVTVAASMFTPFVRRALAAEESTRDTASLRTLHRICRVYAAVGVAVPVLGIGTADSMGILTEVWIAVSIALTIAAAAVLGLAVLPRQANILANFTADTPTAEPALAKALGRLASYTGLFNILWVTVTILMIVRPGSSTHA